MLGGGVDPDIHESYEHLSMCEVAQHIKNYREAATHNAVVSVFLFFLFAAFGG